MKTKLFYLLFSLLFTLPMLSQSPQKMSYQAVIRNSTNNLVSSSSIGMKISILQGSPTGPAVYVETQTPTTNVNGLVSIQIGGVASITGTFSLIDWASGPYFIKTETDPNGGNAYSITSVTELLSVPYALYSGNAHVGGFKHYIGEVFDGGIIYYLYKGSDGLEHGLIVSLTESTAMWHTVNVVVNANSTWDGASNTALMLNSPAKNYVLSLGGGWYLPSVDELMKLFYNRFTFIHFSGSGNILFFICPCLS